MTTEKSIALFEKFGIFTKVELESREEILYETYSKTINIEALTMCQMARKQILPAVMKYTKTLADTVLAVKEVGADASVQEETLRNISAKLVEANKALEALEEKTAKAGDITDQKKKAFYFRNEVFTAMEALRTPVDALETMVDRAAWPIPTYGELIFEV